MGRVGFKSFFYAPALLGIPLMLFSFQSQAASPSNGTCYTLVNGQRQEQAPTTSRIVSSDQKTITFTYSCPSGWQSENMAVSRTIPNPNAPKENSNNSGNSNGNSGGGSQPQQQQQQQPQQQAQNGAPQANTKTDQASNAGCNQAQPNTDSAKQRNCQAQRSIKDAVQRLVQAGITNAAQVQSAYDKYEKAQKSCNDLHGTAAGACLENMSKDLSTGLAAVNGVLSAVNGASSNKSCSDMSKIMDMANKALTAFTGACGATKAACSSACGEATSALNSLKSAANAAQPVSQDKAAAVEAAKPAVASSVQPELSTSDQTSVASKAELCTKKYQEQLASAAAGIAAMLAGMMQGNKCEENTAAATAVDCTKASQANTPTCLCQANPRLPGCDNALQKTGESGSAGITGSGSNLSGTAGAAPTLSGGAETPDFSRTPSGDSSPIGGSSGAGAPIGGSSGIGAAPGLNADGGPAGSRLNTNILGGTTGGSGGWGTASGSGSSSNSKYKDYLPGGAKDPQKLNGNAYATEVTGQGKSNWEKIKERYRDNKPTLLSN